MLELVTDSGIPTVISFHDYYAVHPIYTIQGAKDTLQALTPQYTTTAVGQDITPYIAKRNEYLGLQFAKADKLIVPSNHLATELSKVFAQNFNVIEHGIPPICLEKSKPSDRLRFGFLGSKLPQKGWVDLLSAFAQVRASGYDCELVFIGGGSTEPPDVVPGVHYHGAYDRAQLGTLLPLFDIGVIPSIFAETFSYVLSEHHAGGKPVAASRIGTLGDRVIDGINGKHFRPGNIEDIKNTLIWFIENEDTWRKWSIPKPREIGEMIGDYRSLYRDTISKNQPQWQNEPKER
jgi:glycosyltransferase involved in cell wall biosynthesis